MLKSIDTFPGLPVLLGDMVPLPVSAPADSVPMQVVNLHEGAAVDARAALARAGQVPGDAGGEQLVTLLDSAK